MADIKYNAEKYTEDFELQIDSQSEEAIRQTVNVWASGISFSPVPDLGDKMEILGVNVLKFYRSELFTQFDHRSVSKKSVPYTGQTVPEFINDDPAKIKRWNFNLRTIDKYENIPETPYVISNSQSVDKCHTCGGTGSVVCPTCHGAKSHTCSTCGGSGKVPHIRECSSCHGKGYTVAYTEEHYMKTNSEGKQVYGGVRRIPHQYKCGSCQGKGTVQSGYDTCGRCHGNGKITCSTCGGSGVVTCQTCNGRKKMFQYLTINQQLEYAYRKLHDVDIPDEDFYTVKELLGEEDYELIDRYDNTSGQLEGDYSVIPFAGASAQKLIDEKHAMVGSDTRILFETLKIESTSILAVRYSYKGESFILYITANDKISASNSPVSQFADELKKKAIRQTRLRLLRSADSSFEKLFMMTHNTDFWEMSVSVAGKMRKDMNFGSNIAMVVLTVLLFPFMKYYLSDVSWTAPWIDLAGAAASWTWPLLPYIYTAAVFFGAYKLSRLKWWYIYEKTPSFILRFLLGVVIALGSFSVCTVVAGAAHFLILPAVFETVGQIILFPIRLIQMIGGIIF